MKRQVPTLYLFNNIFYPQTVIPLTVNDATSKKMLISCYQSSTPIALFHPHPRAKGIGTLGQIVLLEHNADGSLNVVLSGLLRIKLISKELDIPYPHYLIDDYYDLDESPQAFNNFPIERLYFVLNTWLNRHVNSASERERFMKDMKSPSKLINTLCMFLIKDVELKQIFLESTSLLDRVRMMNALLIGETPEIENLEMCEAIKNFERLDSACSKNAS